MSKAPGEHDGGAFAVRIKFSEDVETKAKDAGFRVAGGSVAQARRWKERRDLWQVELAPDAYAAVTLTLPAASVRTADGRALSGAVTVTVAGPPGLSVADARVEEAKGAKAAFAVTLSRAATRKVKVSYATADGSARAGEDYKAKSGQLTFRKGETRQTVEVKVFDDAHDEGEETFTLRLSDASGAHLSDGEATGTIENTVLMPAALLARFGRATAEQVVEHVEERMAAPRRRGFRARFAGRELQPGSERDFALGFLSSFAPMGMGAPGGAPMGGATPMAMGSHAAGPGAGMGTMGMSGATRPGMDGMGGMPGAMGMSGQQPMGGGTAMTGYGPAGGAHGGGLFGSLAPGGHLFSDSEFELNRESRGGVLSVWSSSSRSYFSGMEDALSLDGDVRTTMVGADYSRGALTVGLSVGRTAGMGGYGGASGGRMSTSMTGVYPWVGYQVNDRVSVWGVTGYGAGALSLTPDGAIGARDGRVDGDVGGGDAGRADRLAGHGRVRAGVQGRRVVGRRGQRAARRRGGPAERVGGGGDAGAHGAGGLAGLHAGRRPAVAEAERRGGTAARRRRRRDGRGHGRRRRARLHRRGHGAVAGRADADAGGASGRRVHRARDVAVVRVGPDAVEPAGAEREGGPVVGAGSRGAEPRRCGAARWPTGWARTRCTGPAATASTRRWATGCRWAPASWGRRASGGRPRPTVGTTGSATASGCSTGAT